MTELPKTEQELNDLIEQKVQEAKDELTSQHNGAMANMRKKYESDIAKAKEQANMTAEELAQQKIKEQQDADRAELEELRTFKKSAILSEKLKKEGLPDFFKNDTRLLTAEDGNVDKVIKDIKKEYTDSQPKGATHSSVVTNASGQKQTTADEQKEELYREVGETISLAIGK